MKRVAAAAVVFAALAAPALAAAPARITIVSVFDPITVGENGFVNGQLVSEAEDQGGQTVGLEESPYPFEAWTPVTADIADTRGFYSFRLKPSLTTHYRTVSQGVTSEREVQIQVAPRLAFKAVPDGKSRIRYSGTLAPAKAGQSVTVQRQHSNGSWSNVATVTLKAAGKTFTGRLRARKTTVLRAFFASDGAHTNGYSRAVRVAR
jgi:hypothetical protein